MKLVCDVMERPVWLCPDHTIRMAFVTMKGFGIGSLAVVESGVYLGTVAWSDLLDLDPDDLLLSVMRRDAPYLGPGETIEAAARMLVDTGVERLPVVDQGTLMGCVGSHSLLLELGRSVDPLTRLPWADTLRDWAMSRLRGGQEISIVFFDLDDFGQFNKKHGHLVGDQVLQSVAETLRAGVDPTHDVLCRYGGDEFALCTTRGKDGSESLAASLARDIGAIPSPVGDGELGASWGVTGGKRTREREDTHFAATIDNLINLASRQCQAMKEARAKAEPVEDPPPATAVYVEAISLESLNISVAGESATVSIELLASGVPVKAALSGPSHDQQLLKLVAQTAADAISHALPKDTTLVVHDCRITRSVDGDQHAQVLATLYTPTQMREMQGTAVVQGDTSRAAAMAMLQAAEADLIEFISPQSNATN